MPSAAVSQASAGPGARFAYAASFRQLSDLYLFAEGGYAPLRGFLDEAQTRAVCETMHLTSGEPWSIPLVFPIDSETRGRLGSADQLLLMDGESPAGILHVEDIFQLDKDLFARSVFRTASRSHPGVSWLAGAGRHSVAGTVELFPEWEIGIPGSLPISPRDVAARVGARSWQTVVGFQTRNPMHRAHEFCTKAALETIDGLVIHPLLGETMAGDTPPEVRLACYRALMRSYYSPEHVMLAGFPAWMRYAGPREAVFHAQVRKNYGMTHFIVGRDHAGVGGFYGPFDAQRIFSEFRPGELGIEPVLLGSVHYCQACGSMASGKTCGHPPEHHLHVSGTDLRRMLRQGRMPPSEITRPEVAEILLAAERDAP